MPLSKREKRRVENANKATLSELQCYRQIVSAIKLGVCTSAHQVWAKTNFGPAYCKMTLDHLEGSERWNRQLVNTITLKVTADGERAYDYACRVLDAHSAGPFVKPRETLRIGTTNRVMTAFLGPKVREFLWRHRTNRKRSAADVSQMDVDLELSESSLNEILSALRLEEIDIAIGGIPTDDQTADLDRTSIDGKLETVLIAAKGGCGEFTKTRFNEGRRVEWSELSTTDLCVIRSDLHGVLGSLPPQAEGYSRIVVENYASVVSVVKSGAAVGLVLDMGLPEDVLKFELAVSKNRPRTRELAIWTRRGEKLGATAQSFIHAVTGR